MTEENFVDLIMSNIEFDEMCLVYNFMLSYYMFSLVFCMSSYILLYSVNCMSYVKKNTLLECFEFKSHSFYTAILTDVDTLLTTHCYLIYTYSNNRGGHFVKR